MFDWIINRLKEPSTWAGLAGLLGSAGITFSADLNAAFTTAGVAVASLIAIILHETKPGA